MRDTALTQWSRVLLGKLIVAELVIPLFMKLESSLPCSQQPTVRPWPWLPDWSSPHPPNTLSLTSILILFSNLRIRLPYGLSHSGFRTKILYAFFISPMRTKCLLSSHLPWFGHRNIIWRVRIMELHFLYLRSFQTLSPSPMSCVTFRNMLSLRWRVVSPPPNVQTGGLPLVRCLRLLQPQPEGAPWPGDKGHT
jgi:hypothetical protein